MCIQGLDAKTIGSGLPSLDALLQGLRLGDNVVWQVDRLEDYPYIVHVIDVPVATGGASAKVIADPKTRNAICFLDRSRK